MTEMGVSPTGVGHPSQCLTHIRHLIIGSPSLRAKISGETRLDKQVRALPSRPTRWLHHLRQSKSTWACSQPERLAGSMPDLAVVITGPLVIIDFVPPANHRRPIHPAAALYRRPRELGDNARPDGRRKALLLSHFAQRGRQSDRRRGCHRPRPIRRWALSRAAGVGVAGSHHSDQLAGAREAGTAMTVVYLFPAHLACLSRALRDRLAAPSPAPARAGDTGPCCCAHLCPARQR